ncbi:MAG: glycosyltransferase [Acetatifactor sp.]
MGKINFANLKKTVYYLKRNGLKRTLSAVAERIGGAGQTNYRWEPVPERELQKQKEESAAGLSKLVFSILVPAYRTPKAYLCEMIESVLNQTYPNWELILADASGDDSVKCVADSWQDSRIRYFRLPSNEGIAENTNRGLMFASGDYVGLLDHDDVLTENALYEMAVRIEQEKRSGIELQLLYSDEDKCNGDRTEYYEPHSKEKFNLDLLLSNNYICHFMVMKRELLQKLMLRKEYDGAQDFDLVLRAAYELTGQEERIAHIPKVLYHWRCHTSSTAENPQSKLYAYEAGRRAVQDFADRKGWKAKVEDTEHLGFYRVVYQGNLFEMRPELGAVGGPVIHGGKIVGGRMSQSGEVFYRGLPASYSGYLHRAQLAQEAEVLDIRNMEIREELRKLEEVRKLLENFAVSGDENPINYSIELSKVIRRAGYKLLYLPERRVRL